jgi:small-conductance mechanosensitive channel
MTDQSSLTTDMGEVTKIAHELPSFAQRLDALAISYGSHALGAICILIGFWLAARVARHVLLGVGNKDVVRYDLYRVLSQAAGITLILFGALTALGTIGIDITALVAGLGLSGLALGLALKDTVSNFVSGVMLITFRPFVRGDHVAIGDVEGTVIKFDLRHTTIEREGSHYLIPNQNILATTIRIFPADAPRPD